MLVCYLEHKEKGHGSGLEAVASCTYHADITERASLSEEQ